MKRGTALQAIKFSRTLHHEFIQRFLHDWHEDNLADWADYENFCKYNPDEPERSDGRKVHYGPGRQPLDDIIDAGWGPAFCAGNVLKYLRRDKDVEDSKAKARWYYDKLTEMSKEELGFASDVLFNLDMRLNANEFYSLGNKEY